MKFEKARELASLEAAAHQLVRSKERQSTYGEVFTPTPLAFDILENLDDSYWVEGKTFIDPTCGNGQLLVAVLFAKLSLKHTNPLTTIYGVDLMSDNVLECRKRLLTVVGDTADNAAIVEKNVQVGDGTSFDFEFEFDTEQKEKHSEFQNQQLQLFKW
jgi:type I restriction-modification system DNA methylase subunit